MCEDKAYFLFFPFSNSLTHSADEDVEENEELNLTTDSTACFLPVSPSPKHRTRQLRIGRSDANRNQSSKNKITVVASTEQETKNLHDGQYDTLQDVEGMVIV